MLIDYKIESILIVNNSDKNNLMKKNSFIHSLFKTEVIGDLMSGILFMWKSKRDIQKGLQSEDGIMSKQEN
jgi:hypothetical protein